MAFAYQNLVTKLAPRFLRRQVVTHQLALAVVLV
jgi:hypothetical protein